MNYIRLLHAAFEKFYFDDRLNPTHISLYMALFLEWNSWRFCNEFYVNRRELMRCAKIGSKSTYHRCIVDLAAWEYLSYFPSNNPYKGSKIKMSIMGMSNETMKEQYNPRLEQLSHHYHPRGVSSEEYNRPKIEPPLYQHHPVNGQAVVSESNFFKQGNHIKTPKDFMAVLDFFVEKNFNKEEAEKFYSHYNDNDWQTGDGVPVRDWRAVAINWMDRTELLSIEKKATEISPSRNKDNLRTAKSKDYGQPL